MKTPTAVIDLPQRGDLLRYRCTSASDRHKEITIEGKTFKEVIYKLAAAWGFDIRDPIPDGTRMVALTDEPRRGFASMTPERRRALGRQGGKAAQKSKNSCAPSTADSEIVASKKRTSKKQYRRGNPPVVESTPNPTERALSYYRWIWDYHQKCGYAPSVREIARGMGVAIYAVAEMLVRLERWSLIERPKTKEPKGRRALAPARAMRLLVNPKDVVTSEEIAERPINGR